MNITILTYGSRGDVQPFLALALGLRRASHAVRLAAPHRFAALAARTGVDFVPLPGDPEEISLRLNAARYNLFAQVKGMAEYIFSIAEPGARAAFAACADADLIVHSFLFTTGGHSIARNRGIPDVSIQTFPMFAPTRAFPNVAAANLPAGAPSYFSHWFATQIFWHGGNLGFRGLRKKAPAVFDLQLSWPFTGEEESRTPLLFAFSPVVIPRPVEWKSAHIHIPGYFFLEELEPYRPTAELEAFLSAGDAPVCITFGSMINQEAGRIHSVMLSALARLGKRAVFLTGWGGPAGENTPDCFYLDSAPHSWLFPRCQAVIHHGGAGTTAACLRAGIPNLILPHTADQPFWGKRVAAIGAGPRPIAINALSVETLSAALAQMDSPALRGRAAEIGRLIQAEDGVSAAVRLIEERAKRYKRPPV
jgi:UDP:flavonoid glycosyltransferase YjiC (YdhE family)